MGTVPIDVGAVLGGKYKVLAKLGEGGMGTVFRAENVLTGKLVAIKCMHSQVAASADSTERLLREARAASSLSHPNVVDVYDLVLDGQIVFLVMELLRGETLRAYLQRNAQPPISEFIALILPALAGVAAAHENGVIHRDLKPDNIFLERVAGVRHGVAKVLDFGVAKLADARGQTLTQTGVAIGTPLYMSLEQLRGDKNIDARTDVYAFGVMLFEALTGQTPFQAQTLPELAIKVATTDPPPVKSLRPDIPTSLARIVDWAVARERSQRLPDIQTLIDELEVFAREHSFRAQMTQHDVELPRLAAEPAAVAVSAPEPEPPSHDTLRARELIGGDARRGAGRARWAVAATLILGAALALGWAAWRQPPTAASTPAREALVTPPIAVQRPTEAAPAPTPPPQPEPEPEVAEAPQPEAPQPAAAADVQPAAAPKAAPKKKKKSSMDLVGF